jgi:tRNA pseudouridine55 synthase
MNSLSSPEGQMILIDKPLGWTSFDVVRKLKFAIRAKKIGHAGTLDPLASGLLILCTEKMTKHIDSYQAQEKEYTGTLVLGKTTPSVDLETPFDAIYPIEHIQTEHITAATARLTGSIEQVPPLYSAVMIDGKRAYSKARKGDMEAEASLKVRNVIISLFETDASRFPEVDFRIVCSKGTYIRSLVRDLGKLLESGAYLAALRRTRIGEFKVEDALGIDAFVALHRNQQNQPDFDTLH